MKTQRPRFLPLLLLGVAAGVLSGLFGVGGGTIIVPGLVLWLGMQQKLAAGTSVAAILPTATVGAISYAVQGHVDWVAAACLAVGIVVGAQLGSYLLARVSKAALQWGFMGFLLVVIVSLWVVVPQRGDEIAMSPLVAVLLVLTGLVTGVISGLIGVGGGIVVVPVLMFFFGANDLAAKGSSLVMMIPGSISGTLGNIRRSNVDLRSAAIIGISASVCVPFSSVLAALIDPFVSNVLFSLYLAFVLTQMLWRALKSRRG
ncbi:sulfite exporter TauE/SafE family protein [Leucobacter insecticola]|uniref:Probable membrane transporter protein n=1 Tax=Leucobacter insecticola TaxID=2714934 RepID=A0A6G8FGG7_9MICO|nr:sulfite exporter TauE/SafE family protein [Leucobacter insecticola]QIM15353.1 sulfite exporter TauE/SafE family protein [Leucobacter insecticola]